MKTLFAFLFLLAGPHLFAQDTDWKLIKIDENMQIELPGKVAILDTVVTKSGRTQFLHSFKTTTQNATLGVTITPGPDNGKQEYSPALLKKNLNDVAEGFKQGATAAKWTSESNDITIDNIPGKKVLVKSEERHIAVTNYIFIINNKLYILVYNQRTDGSKDTSVSEIKRLLQSIHFTATKAN